jgi:hypothetical protein
METRELWIFLCKLRTAKLKKKTLKIKYNVLMYQCVQSSVVAEILLLIISGLVLDNSPVEITVMNKMSVCLMKVSTAPQETYGEMEI